MFILSGVKSQRQSVRMRTDKKVVRIRCRCYHLIEWEPLNKPEASCPICALKYIRVPYGDAD